MGRSLGNMKRMCDLRWSGKGLQESYFHAFIIMEKKRNLEVLHMKTMVYRNVDKNAESTTGISSRWCLVAFQVFFKKNYEKNGILVPSIEGESVSPFS